jgi:glycosyltransferase involved in cell wall biosynthesis
VTELSLIIPARNETYLRRTIENVLENIQADTEIIAVADGYWPDPVIQDNPRVILLHHTEARGQRQSINEAARIAKGKYLMKLDAHCWSGLGS